MSDSRPYLLAETTWKSVQGSEYAVAVLPWGATEAHNLHLPYGTDSIEVSHIAAESARIAWEQGTRVIVLPTVPFGVNTGQLDIPLCLNLNPSTQAAVLGDLAESIERAGIRRLVLLNGHGGNDFRAMIRELVPLRSLFICTVNWYTALDPRPFFAEPGDHAGELETSAMLSIAGELVRPLAEAGSGQARRFRVRGLREGLAWAPRRWSKLTTDTGVGDPHQATAEKGARFLHGVVNKLAAFLTELAAVDPEELYE
ncbi:MAG TPA: creatininase family protein [Gemmatimonadales bacterium]|jgi:creatinine amidohydrolase|nr:creatininase family protein [Gemmatimonadales bacterium]